MREMTCSEFLTEYGDVEVFFDSYYKYSFTFRSREAGEPTISVSFGGCSDDIYRYEVAADTPEKISEFLPSSTWDDEVLVYVGGEAITVKREEEQANG